GLGKTHLIQAIAAELRCCGRDRSLYIPSDRLIDELMESFKNRSVEQVRKRLSSARWLLVDDIHFLSGRQQIQEEFYHIFDAIYRQKGQIVLTSDRPPKEIPQLPQRLVSRFGDGAIVTLAPPCLRTRIAIIRHKAARLGLALRPDSILLLASRIRTNVRRMEGALNRIAAHAAMTGHPASWDRVEEVLRDTLFEDDGEGITIRKIQQAVSAHYRLKPSLLLGATRAGGVALPRQIAMYLCRKLTGSPFADIGAAFSGRDHTTALHACKTVEGLLSSMTETREAVDELVASIRP
ncbi:MAG: chromosomal replication initiator protein DnaA, partial [Candidatus Aureabacteria bacterium]|nr:chromosomal replication initiator protein DnaA [Candidatus Auribacterota bacterium]